MQDADVWRRQLVSGVQVLTTGTGPGLVVVPGNNRRAHHYEALARGLSGAHTVHVIERRGRGASAARGPAYSVETDVDDVLAVLEQTGARVVFGHSYGGLVALHVGLRRQLDALIAYEPGVSIDGSFDGSWLGGFTRQLDAGRRVAAMTTFLKGTDLLPFRAVPLLWAISLLLVRGPGSRETRDMMPTTPGEIAEILRLDSDGSRYAGIASRTLLLGGARSPAYLTGVLPRLATIMPNAEFRILPDLDHNAPDENAPDTIAQELRLHLVRGERHHHETLHDR
ncbi:alpha/beta fold hydrolase [Kribbella sp. VKM Ac-2566]|uniref:alpha/beta fold hydrolase n=1 Tax=Kribbella sp. VKM Ac-2566 TaxID=2512218 RepID=UPI0010635BF3|nr:alpha/beta hydrolase [Kribbella sp. VKM Ac-2566]TDX03913.1 pimeloyl-ACP methyl ester carboxylesterase [Kribbella sp. VKM Ac-2566]